MASRANGRSVAPPPSASRVSLEASLPDGSPSILMGFERSLTLKQMRDLIDELYISKLVHDAKCAEAKLHPPTLLHPLTSLLHPLRSAETKLPRETMEQHLYTSFNTKYGLKTLILEYANASLDGIRRYSQEDNDVAVFGCILRNEARRGRA